MVIFVLHIWNEHIEGSTSCLIHIRKWMQFSRNNIGNVSFSSIVSRVGLATVFRCVVFIENVGIISPITLLLRFSQSLIIIWYDLFTLRSLSTSEEWIRKGERFARVLLVRVGRQSQQCHHFPLSFLSPQWHHCPLSFLSPQSFVFPQMQTWYTKHNSHINMGVSNYINIC